jgi:hypothetical protein
MFSLPHSNGEGVPEGELARSAPAGRRTQRDAYGVKVLASAAFTQGLVSRGVISLGMG